MPRMTLEERLRTGYVVAPDSECWIWQLAPDSSGYGRISFRDGGRRVFRSSHRMMYELMVGPIPDGLVIDHLCRNPICCNPEHLEAVTQQTNLLRGETLQAENIGKTHCKFGHKFSPENTRIVPRGRRCITCERRRARESALRKKGKTLVESETRPCQCGISTGGDRTVHGSQVVAHRVSPVDCYAVPGEPQSDEPCLCATDFTCLATEHPEAPR